jgi:hypothetical protein
MEPPHFEQVCAGISSPAADYIGIALTGSTGARFESTGIPAAGAASM